MQNAKKRKIFMKLPQNSQANVVKSWKIRFFLCYTQATLEKKRRIGKKRKKKESQRRPDNNVPTGPPKKMAEMRKRESGRVGVRESERYLYYVKYLPTLNSSITTQLEPAVVIYPRDTGS